MRQLVIPKIIHQVWVGAPMPEHLRRFTDRWRELHPTWEYRLWGDTNLDWLHNREPYAEAHRFVPWYRVGQLRADVARYEILYAHGGLYADVDTEPLRAVDNALVGLSEFAVAEFGDGGPDYVGGVGNALIACAPGESALAAIINEIAGAWRGWRPHGRNVPAALTGPAPFTRAWLAHGRHVEPSSRWYPYTYAQVVTGEYPRDFDDAYVVHHWEHIRELRRLGLMG